MYKKTCPSCNGDSYSSAGKGRWICPYCESDLSNITLMLPNCWDGAESKVEGKVIPLEKHKRGNLKPPKSLEDL